MFTNGVFIYEPASDLAENLWICPPSQSACGILVYEIRISEVNLLLYYMKMGHCIYPTLGNTVESVSMFNWFIEINCCRVSFFTVILAGGIRAMPACTLDRRFARFHRDLTRVLRRLLYVPCLLTGFDPEPGTGPA